MAQSNVRARAGQLQPVEAGSWHEKPFPQEGRYLPRRIWSVVIRKLVTAGACATALLSISGWSTTAGSTVLHAGSRTRSTVDLTHWSISCSIRSGASLTFTPSLGLYPPPSCPPPGPLDAELRAHLDVCSATNGTSTITGITGRLSRSLTQSMSNYSCDPLTKESTAPSGLRPVWFSRNPLAPSCRAHVDESCQPDRTFDLRSAQRLGHVRTGLVGRKWRHLDRTLRGGRW